MSTRWISPSVAYTDYTSLISSATGALLLNPTLAVGDVQISLDGGAFNNLTALPTALPAAQDQVQYVLSALEVGVNTVIALRFKDQTVPSEWDTQIIWHRTDNGILPSTAYTDYTALVSTATGAQLTTPTLAVGDVQISADGGGFVNLTALPTVTPAAQCQVQFVISALEVGLNTVINLRFKDQTFPAEWEPQVVNWFRPASPSTGTAFSPVGGEIVGA